MPVFAPAAASPPPTSWSRKAISWDLSSPAAASESAAAVPAYELPTHVPTANREEMFPGRSATLSILQAELDDLRNQIAEHRQTKDSLTQDVTNLKAETLQLEKQAKTLQDEVNDLKHCRTELEQFLAYMDAKRQELELGSNPLQAALKQLQTQVTSLQEELHHLETQIEERRTEKATLEQQCASLREQSSTLNLRSQHTASEQSDPTDCPDQTQETTLQTVSSQLQSIPEITTEPVHSPPIAPQGSASVSKPSENALPDLSGEWTELMLQLPEYELQVLKAIATQRHPAGLIKKIAEKNRTTPEALINSINERALDLVGDTIIISSSNNGAVTIARDHGKSVKQLLKMYAYLTQ
jgi:DNA repair exonuclease SbcCD ATPase subunit